MSVMFAGTPIYEGSDDLCAKTACPIAPGPATITYKQDLPPIAPPVCTASPAARLQRLSWPGAHIARLHAVRTGQPHAPRSVACSVRCARPLPRWPPPRSAHSPPPGGL